MDFTKVKEIVDEIKNGQCFSVELLTNQSARVCASAKKNGISVVKHSVNVCRKGIEYSNTNYINTICTELGYIVGERANGTKDTENKAFADSKLGNKLIDLFSMTCAVDRVLGNHPINESKTEYIITDSVNGTTTIVDYATLENMGIMQPSFFKANTNKEKYAKMLEMRAEWENDKANYPTDKKLELARLIRDLYNKMFSVKVENIVAINGIK